MSCVKEKTNVKDKYFGAPPNLTMGKRSKIRGKGENLGEGREFRKEKMLRSQMPSQNQSM